MSLFYLLYGLRLAHPTARWGVRAASLAVYTVVRSLYLNPTFAPGMTLMLCNHSLPEKPERRAAIPASRYGSTREIADTVVVAAVPLPST